MAQTKKKSLTASILGWRKRTAMSSFFSQGRAVRHLRDDQPGAAALYRCRAVHTFSGCTLQCGADPRRGYALQKQDILCKQAYHHDVPEDAEFLTRSYFNYFEEESSRRYART